MNSIQLGIVAVIAFLILVTIGYYWYQEIRFKRIVENNFNNSSFDISEASAAMVLESNTNEVKPILQKDIAQSFASEINLEDQQQQPELGLFTTTDTNIEIPDDSLEAIFIKLDSIPFPFNDKINYALDYVVDIAFEEPQKLKFIPEITQFTQNIFKIYVLDKNNMWQEYIKSNKYYAIAIKIVIEMVNQEGVISHMQINNIYNELRKFILQNNAHIRQSDYSTALTTIQNQIKYAAEVKLDLELFLILKEKISYTTLNSFFLHHGLIEQNGQYLFIDNNITSFSISDEYHRGLAHDLSYNLLLINSPLHLSSNPNQVIDKIFDLTEKFMHQFESRLLTTNRQSFTSNDYNHLLRHISNYITNAKKYNLELGGALLHRIH